MTVTTFANNCPWSGCRHHLVGQLNIPSTPFSESRKDTSMPSDAHSATHLTLTTGSVTDA